MSEIKQALMPFAAFAEHAIENVNGTWVWKNNTQNERICDWFGPSDFGATLSSAAVAEREPVAWVCCEITESGGRGPRVIVSGASVPTGYDGISPLYLDPPPTSELEAENAKLRGERDVAVAAMVRNQERCEAAESRLAEALKAVEKKDAAFDAIIAAFSVAYLGCEPPSGVEIEVIELARAARHVREGDKVDG